MLNNHPPKPSQDALIDLLKSQGIAVTQHRLDILACLYQAAGHPDAEEVYEALRSSGHYISRATVYNTLSLFEAKGILHSLEIDALKLRYDLASEPHGHFHCLTCGHIYNFPVAMDALAQGLPASFAITQQDVYFKGTCPHCQHKQMKEEETP